MPDGSRYDDDFYLWTKEQADRLREAASARSNLDLDWQNLAEEIESVGNSQRRELRSRVTVLLEHLLKLRYSPAVQPREGWASTVRRQRRDVEQVLKDSLSLKAAVSVVAEEEFGHASEDARDALVQHGEDPSPALSDLDANRDLVERVLELSSLPDGLPIRN